MDRDPAPQAKTQHKHERGSRSAYDRESRGNKRDNGCYVSRV